MTLLGLTGLSNFLTSAGLAWLVFRKCPRRDWARAYALVNLVIAIWAFWYTVWQCAPNAHRAVFPLQALTAGGMWVNPALIYFIFVLRGDVQKRRTELTALMIANVAFSILDFAGLLFTGVEPRGGFGYWGIITPWFVVYFAFWHVELVYAFWRLWLAYRAAEGLHREQLKYLMTAFAIGYFGGITNWPLWFNIYFPPYPNILISVYVSLVAYAMIRHQLMDIRIAIRKTLIYSAVTLILTVLYVVLLFLMTKRLEGWWASPSLLTSAAAAGVIAVLFHPLRTRLQLWLDRRFPRESLDQNLLREVTGTFVHEMKGPLAGISLPAELALADLDALDPELKDRGALPKVRERLQHILHQSLDLGHMIEALRALGSGAPSRHAVLDIGILLRAVAKRERPRLDAIGAQLRIVQADSPLHVSGDVYQLELVFQNMIKNALDSLSDGERVKEIHIDLNRAGRRCQIRLRDSGRGILAKDLGHIFDPYYTSKGSGGMGIGLYLARQIIQAHHGGITVRSQAGEGTEFRIDLPLAAGDD